MRDRSAVRTAIVSILAAVAIWRWCVVPLAYEKELLQFENATLAASKFQDDRALILARRTIARIRPWSRMFPGDVRLSMIEGSNRTILGEASAAAAAYERGLKYDRRPEIYLNLAIAQQQLGDFENGARNLAKAIRFNPEMASDVSLDERLKNAAIRIIRGGDAPVPFCCAARYDTKGAPGVIDLRTGGALMTGGEEAGGLPAMHGRMPVFAWCDATGLNLIVRSPISGATERLVMKMPLNGTILRRETAPAMSNDWRVAGIGNFAGAGTTSLLLSNTLTSAAKLWTFDGFGHITETAAPGLVEPSATIAACADFDNDGHTDVVYRSSSGADFLMLLVNTTKLVKIALPSGGFQRELIAAADFDSDTYPDLLWYDFENQRLLLWKMKRYSIAGVQSWPAGRMHL